MYKDSAGSIWYKGNLHMHTTRSDGRLSPEEASELYRQNGYDFIALTDHWKQTMEDDFKGLLRLSGCEYNIGATPREGIYHILAIGCTNDPAVSRSDDAQAIVDRIHAAGGLAVLAHPAWSINTPEQIESVRGFDATEIFNSVSDFPRNIRPYSGTIVDMLSSKVGTSNEFPTGIPCGIPTVSCETPDQRGSGIPTVSCENSQGSTDEGKRYRYVFPLLATDDAHWYGKEDACRSYIMVRAKECTRSAILDSIRALDFYATQGPHIDMVREGEKIHVTVESEVPCERIAFFSDSVWVDERCFIAHGIREATYTIQRNDTFVRVEVCDGAGRYAWSNIVRV